MGVFFLVLAFVSLFSMRFIPAFLTALCFLLLQGCETVAVHEQRLVSKPNMTFSDSFLYAYQSRLTAQVEPGAASSGGAQAAGCTSCK